MCQVLGQRSIRAIIKLKKIYFLMHNNIKIRDNNIYIINNKTVSVQL
jgi:hypothetical protein